MVLNRVKRLPGMQDLHEEEYLRLHRAQERLQGLLTAYGYRTVETPLLELTETFVRKGGGALAARMYRFEEPGGHAASVRPEFTSAVARLFLEEEGQHPLPVRWQYSGAVLRYEAEQTDRPRQSWQVGAELIGATGAWADAETVAIAAKGLQGLGLQRVQVVLSDLGVLRAFLAYFGLSERAQRFLLRSLPSLKGDPAQKRAVRERAMAVGLVRDHESREELHHLLARVASREPGGDGQEGASVGGRLGSRSHEEIAARLQRRTSAADELGVFDRALDFLYDLAQASSAPQDALDRALGLAEKMPIDKAPFLRLREMLGALRSHNLGQPVHVDLALAHDIAYYTGIIFEVRAVGRDGATALGSGGRYDGLFRALGAPKDVPAIGFAFALDQIVGALRVAEALGGRERPPRKVLVAPMTPSAYAASLRVAETLRLGGEVAEQTLDSGPLGEHLQYARAKGIDAVVVVREGGESERYLVEEPTGNPPAGRS